MVGWLAPWYGSFYCCIQLFILFILFNNAVILQWVQGTGATLTFTLPITYTQDFCVVGTSGNGTGNTYKNSLNSITQSSYGANTPSRLMLITIGY